MNKTLGKPTTTSGFTLLEILVVMVIASLMITLVPPLFSGAVSGARIKGSVRDFAITLRETRSKAIIHNSEQQIHLDLENLQYRVGNAEPLPLAENMTMDVELITGAKVEGIDKHVVHFFPDGSSSGEMLTLKSGNHVYHLHLNWLTGNITISSGTDNAV